MTQNASSTVAVKKATIKKKPVLATAAPAPKKEAKAKPAKAAPVAKAKVVRPQKPSIPMHSISGSYTGASGLTKARATRTEINFQVFGTRPDLPMTDRDEKALADLKLTFEKRTFQRANLDAGILKRLGERGMIEHVSGSGVAPDATFKLSALALKR